jgi:mannose-6-phosphate isomerase
MLKRIFNRALPQYGSTYLNILPRLFTGAKIADKYISAFSVAGKLLICYFWRPPQKRQQGMRNLYPLKFTPVYKEKVWGGHRIKSSLGKDFSPLHNCGEAWMLSGMEGDETLVKNGFLAGNSLRELTEVYMEELLGDEVFGRYDVEFPLLVKFIDSEDWLSVQVHPGQDLAASRHGSRGKAEMWYILEAEEGAEAVMGFRPGTTRDDYLAHLESGKLPDILNFEKVSGKDVFYNAPGTVHALGPGILLLEIQEASDITYRIHDWDRIDAAGFRRELHTQDALAAINFDNPPDFRINYRPKKNGVVNLLSSPWFTTNFIGLDKGLEKDYSELDSFVILVTVSGSLTLGYGNESIRLDKGELVLLPAVLDNIRLIPDGKAMLVETCIR